MNHFITLVNDEIIEQVSSDADSVQGMVQINSPVDWTKRPSEDYRAFYINGQISWIDVTSLADEQVIKWDWVKSEVARRVTGVFSSNGRVFNIDPLNWVGATLDAYIALQNGEDHSQPWVLANNTIVTLTTAETIAAGRACKAFIQSTRLYSQVLRAQIIAAKTVKAVRDIDWPE